MKGSSFESFISNPESLDYLHAWKTPNQARINVPSKSFSAFMPNEISSIKIGETWNIIPVVTNHYDEHLSNNRYHPPELKSNKEVLVFKLLQMFHKNVFLYPRFPPTGATMYLRAYNDIYLDILFRIHAEYQINEPPHFPFWFTPSGFNGRLIIAKNLSKVLYFNMFVPHSKRLNVDMEWLNDDNEQNMEVDIGYMVG